MGCCVLLRGGGSVWPVNASLFRYGSECRQCGLFSAEEGGQTEWCICCTLMFALAGCAVNRCFLLLRVALFPLPPALAGRRFRSTLRVSRNGAACYEQKEGKDGRRGRMCCCRSFFRSPPVFSLINHPRMRAPFRRRHQEATESPPRQGTQ